MTHLMISFAYPILALCIFGSLLHAGLIDGLVGFAIYLVIRPYLLRRMG